MTSLALLGAMFGVGILCVVTGLRQTGNLANEVARFDIGPWPPGPEVGEVKAPHRLKGLGSSVARAANALGRPIARQEDLTLLGKKLDQQLGATGLCAVAGGVVALCIEVALRSGGVVVGPVLLMSLVIASSVAAATLPAVELARSARRERREILRAVSCWLELVAMAQAGGMGVESALQTAACVSSDRSFERLRRALEHAHLTSTTPWSALRQMGADLGIVELEDLGATLALAGTEGARVRATLVAKSAALRRRQMAEAQGEANATTERLFLPSIVLMLAFVMFLMYPAGVRLAHLF